MTTIKSDRAFTPHLPIHIRSFFCRSRYFMPHLCGWDQRDPHSIRPDPLRKIPIVVKKYVTWVKQSSQLESSTVNQESTAGSIFKGPQTVELTAVGGV